LKNKTTDVILSQEKTASNMSANPFCFVRECDASDMPMEVVVLKNLAGSIAQRGKPDSI
jgi:hypothetical protein